MSNKSTNSFDPKPWQVYLAIFIILGVVSEYIWPPVKSFGITIFATSSSKNLCAQMPYVLNAKTDFAAKAAYKECLRRYN
jgi:hypothetical protein